MQRVYNRRFSGSFMSNNNDIYCLTFFRWCKSINCLQDTILVLKKRKENKKKNNFKNSCIRVHVLLFLFHVTSIKYETTKNFVSIGPPALRKCTFSNFKLNRIIQFNFRIFIKCIYV